MEQVRPALRRTLTLIAALSLAACGSEQPIPGGATQAAADHAAGQGAGQGETTTAAAAPTGPVRRILAFGDSLFAGYNVPKDQSYPAELERALRADGIDAQVTNAGVSGDTSAAGRQRFAFTLKSMEHKPDLLILELGGNDLLRGLSPDQTRANLAAIIEAAQAQDIPVLLMGLAAPANFGGDYVSAFNAVYPSLAKQYDIPLIANWVSSVEARPELRQQDRIHPTEEGIDLLVASTSERVEAALAR